MKRVIVFLIVLVLLSSCALSEMENPAANAVELLFAAAAGVSYEEEAALRQGMTEAEAQQRTAENAAYRASVLPWLMEVFAMPDAPASEDTDNESTDVPIVNPDLPTWEDQVKTAYDTLSTRKTGVEYLSAMEASAGECGYEAVLIETRRFLSEWISQVDHVKLAEINPEYLCWLYCANSMIDYPVVQAEDNSKYLHIMFNGAYNSAGTLFADYRNLPDFMDPNTLIYGHHMRNGSMFGTLVKYGEQAYYDSHPYWLALRDDEIDLIELFAGYTTSRNDHCYDIAISDETDKMLFIDEARAKSDFDDGGVVFLPEDRLVTLSTCAYAFENARYIAIGRLVTLQSSDKELSPEKTVQSVNDKSVWGETHAADN